MTRAERRARIEALEESVYHGTYTVAAMQERKAAGWRGSAAFLNQQRVELTRLLNAERADLIASAVASGDGSPCRIAWQGEDA